MKISERKKRLRRRGIVPVAQQDVQSVKATPTTRQATTKAGRGAPAAKGGKAAPRRQRRPLGPNYQLAIGVLYVLFSPFLFIYYTTLMSNPKSKVHPGALELVLTVAFFAFGVWNLYLGIKGKRRQQAEKRQQIQQAEQQQVRQVRQVGKRRDVATPAEPAATIEPAKRTRVFRFRRSSSQP